MRIQCVPPPPKGPGYEAKWEGGGVRERGLIHEIKLHVPLWELELDVKVQEGLCVRGCIYICTFNLKIQVAILAATTLTYT